MTDYVPQERGGYLLGRLERAAQADKPFEHGYADFRSDLLFHIRGLELNDCRIASVRAIVRAEAFEEAAALVEQMTYRRRLLKRAVNGSQAVDGCEYAAAIRALRCLP